MAAVDLVLGSPPCQDYSKVNGHRQGVTGEQGSYHHRLGLMIRKMEKLAKEQGRQLYFLVENVVTNGDDSAKLEEAYGVPPIHVNAKNYSPTRRYRAFYTNLPLSEENEQEQDVISKYSGAKGCLQDDYVLKGELNGGPDYLGGKALTFMASPGRFDHSRMKVVKYSTNGEAVHRLMNVVERSRMMGYHDAYVTEPLRHIFKTLLGPLRGGRAGGHNWPTDLQTDYHCFSGLHHKFDGNDYLKIAAPPSGLHYKEEAVKGKKGKRKIQMAVDAPVCFDEEEYGYHLIGNAYSVPVVEMLLRPLKKVYMAGDQYSGYQYQYYWMKQAGTS